MVRTYLKAAAFLLLPLVLGYAALLWSILRDRRQNLSSTAAGAPART